MLLTAYTQILLPALVGTPLPQRPLAWPIVAYLLANGLPNLGGAGADDIGRLVTLHVRLGLVDRGVVQVNGDAKLVWERTTTMHQRPAEVPR